MDAGLPNALLRFEVLGRLPDADCSTSVRAVNRPARQRTQWVAAMSNHIGGRSSGLLFILRSQRKKSAPIYSVDTFMAF